MDITFLSLMQVRNGSNATITLYRRFAGRPYAFRRCIFYSMHDYSIIKFLWIPNFGDTNTLNLFISNSKEPSWFQNEIDGTYICIDPELIILIAEIRKLSFVLLWAALVLRGKLGIDFFICKNYFVSSCRLV